MTETFTDIGYAKPDHDRVRRRGVGEVVYGEGKTAPQITGICRELVRAGQKRVLVTRVNDEKMAALEQAFSDEAYQAFSQAHLFVCGYLPQEAERIGKVAVVVAGTSDLPVAEEAALTAEFLGAHVERVYDVGVAGLHRLAACSARFSDANAIVAVAGMEGALPSVVAGMVACPVIAVPTSVGYGASFGGIAALLGMLNSCASGVSVVNIDNGFGAGYQAALINRQSVR
jgi:pyridinium-3,5-biscarboxylic acid mononucleotide synthase